MDVVVRDGTGIAIHRKHGHPLPLALSDGGIAPETATRQLRQRSTYAYAVPLGERSRHRQHIVIDRYRGSHWCTIALSHHNITTS